MPTLDGAGAVATFVFLEISAALIVFVVFPGVPAAVWTAFMIVVGRTLGLRISDGSTYAIAATCAAVAPLPELALGVLGPPGVSGAALVGLWAMLLPGACLGAFSAAWLARRFRPVRDPIEPVGAGATEPDNAMTVDERTE
jgi:hypothetical protein